VEPEESIMGLPNHTLALVGHDGKVRLLDQRSPLPSLQDIISFVRKSPREQLHSVCRLLEDTDWYWKVHNPGNDRTAYVLGLFGTGRWYLVELLRDNIGERAKFLRPTVIRLRPGRTSMIYSDHATIKYTSRAQALPAVTSRILEAVTSRSADLIFIYRHPLDSLLTNWVWWRTYLRCRSMNGHISNVYKGTDDFCDDLERQFVEFKAFAEGDADFFAALPGQRFLSFPEFVEETELFIRCATLTLRFEDFMIDPLKEFSKIVEVMSVDLDVSRLRVAPPRTKPYGYLAVKEKVPRFRNFINELDAETKRRIEKIGYSVGEVS
jgi:hypothetical protein